MAPAVSAGGTAPAGAWSIFKPLSWPARGTSQRKVAHEGQEMQMHYDPVLKKWVEKGKEGEVDVGDCPAPPPTLFPMPRVAEAAPRCRTRRPITDRYARQGNLSVTSSLDSLNLDRSASAPLPPCSFISPPASTCNFYVPAPPPNPATAGEPLGHHGPATVKDTALRDHEIVQGLAPERHGSPPLATTMLAPSTPCPAHNTLHHAEAACSTGTSAGSSPDSKTYNALPGLVCSSEVAACDTLPAATTQELSAAPPLIPSAMPSHAPLAPSCMPPTQTEPGSRCLHNGKRFAFPRAPTHWASFQTALTSAAADSTSRRDQGFDAAMHPSSAAKLDGPLPWELPSQLRYSQDFISICASWQRKHPGELYTPQQLLLDSPPPAEDDLHGSNRRIEVVGYLQRMVHSLKSKHRVSDEELKGAITMLSSLIASHAEREAPYAAPAAATAKPAAALIADAQQLHILDSMPSPFANQVVPVWSAAAPQEQATVTEAVLEQRLAALRQQMKEEGEQQLAAQAAELELHWESQVSTMRRELEAEYERRMQEKEAELLAQQQVCVQLQDDLDHLLLCLGQESRKVTDLSQAMTDAGLDADAIVMSIEEEYAMIDLATSY